MNDSPLIDSRSWTNAEAIARWDASFDRGKPFALDEEGDFVKRHLVNPQLLRLLGDVDGRRVLDAGCGNGYFARILAGRGAHVVGVEPASSRCGYARGREADEPLGVEYVEADLSALPDLGRFDAVVCSMVLMAIPDWRAAMRACVSALNPGGRFVFALVHPAFERLHRTWQEHGEYRMNEYLAEYEVPGPDSSDFHRPLSAYLNELSALGCRFVEMAEPRLDPAVAAADPDPALAAYVHLPNFVLVAADAP